MNEPVVVTGRAPLLVCGKHDRAYKNNVIVGVLVTDATSNNILDEEFSECLPVVVGYPAAYLRVRAFTQVSTFLGASENEFGFRNLIRSEKACGRDTPEVGCPLIMKCSIIPMNVEESNNLDADDN